MTSPTNDEAALRRRVDELTSAVIDERISSAEQEELQRLLSTDHAAREAFLEQLDVEALLRGREYRVGEASFVRPRTTSPPLPTSSKWKKTFAFATLAASLLVMTVLVLTYGFCSKEREQLATIVELDRTEWGDKHDALLSNDAIGRGGLSLQQGSARLRTVFGVELTLTAPCRIEFLDAKLLKVHQGRVSAKVNDDGGVGFRIVTPTIDLVDLGTEFGVLVDPDGASEVHVFDGVVVARARDAEQVVPIYRDEAGRATAEPDAERESQGFSTFRSTSLVAVTARPELFGRTRPAEQETSPPNKSSQSLPVGARVLFLGDSFLDADAPLLLLEDTWHEGGVSPAPHLINGFVPDTLTQIIEGFEHHVLRRRPSHVVLMFGPDYALLPKRRLSPDEFGAQLAKLVDHLVQAGIEPILATGYRFRPAQSQAQKILDRYNEQIRILAERKELRLADVDQHFQVDLPLESLVGPDGRILSFAASRLMTAALLEAWDSLS